MVDSDKDLRQVWGLLMKGAMVLLLIAAFLGGCTYFNSKMKLEDDHLLEQIAEDMVEHHLGLPDDSVDFTPEYQFEYE